MMLRLCLFDLGYKPFIVCVYVNMSLIYMTQCTPTCENGMPEYIEYFYNSEPERDPNILAVGRVSNM